jgi:hypothetical protein
VLADQVHPARCPPRPARLAAEPLGEQDRGILTRLRHRHLSALAETWPAKTRSAGTRPTEIGPAEIGPAGFSGHLLWPA